MKPGRRNGSDGAKTRDAILDATEALMREEGYAAVSSRRVAERAGLRPSLVHYHFGSMEDLFLALYKRTQDRYFERHIKALTAANPIRALWEFSADPSGTELVLEFIALGSHNRAIREEIARSGEVVRKIEIAFFTRMLEDYGIDQAEYPASVISFLIAGASRAFVTETTLGISTGHSDVLAFFERRLRDLEASRDRTSQADAQP